MTTATNKKGFTPSNDSDEFNPQFLFNMTAGELLVAIAKGELDAVELAKKELANRGTGINGFWVGFDNAKKEWKLK